MRNATKVVEVNLEYGRPTVDMAVKNMKNALTTCKKQGSKAVILVHGYGSSGVGGAIKLAIRRELADRSMSGIVRAAIGGEEWHVKKKDVTSLCPALDEYERRLCHNEGVTIVVLRQ
ncbi:MAG: hypothetical protein Q8N36_05555 [bacterium]|nr:hypothetical protein [bacterium]